MTETTHEIVQVAVDDQGIATLTIDVPNESTNTLKANFVEQFTALLDRIETDSSIKGAVFISAKTDCFIAGADVNMLEECTSSEQAATLAKHGQRIFQRMENCPKTLVAAIHGVALGGGLEFAMACHYRVCSLAEVTQLGLPEVQLGLLPGSGGTQRLPRIIGLQNALSMILTGRRLRAKQAKRYGLVDDAVPLSILSSVARQLALRPPRRAKVKQAWWQRVIEGNSFGRGIIFKQAEKQALAQSQGNYPAIPAILESVKAGFHEPATGYAIESHWFGRLVMTPESKALRRIFFATTAMKKEKGAVDAEPLPLRQIGVLGGGLMGAGIAHVSAIKAKLPVRIKEVSPNGIANALNYSAKLLQKKVKKKQLSDFQAKQSLAQITGDTQFRGHAKTDVMIEAVFEDLALKQQMVKEVESHCSESTIFASNTSSIPITDIAVGAARPERIVGLHYFSPVEKMPLVEVIPHTATSPVVISTVVELARRQGKTPIVVNDSPGFYVNRILTPYMAEAGWLAVQGQSIDAIDGALVQFGFPVGPFKLLDEVGIDVGTKIIPILVDAYGERFQAPPAFTRLLDAGRLGRKNGSGFYLYNGRNAGSKAGKKVDPDIYSVLGVAGARDPLPANELVERCLLLMLNEAARCLAEGVIRSPRDGDIGAIFGIGFPPFTGGPFSYMDTIGVDTVVHKLQRCQTQFGDKFAPCERLLEMTAQSARFYQRG